MCWENKITDQANRFIFIWKDRSAIAATESQAHMIEIGRDL